VWDKKKLCGCVKEWDKAAPGSVRRSLFHTFLSVTPGTPFSLKKGGKGARGVPVDIQAATGGSVCPSSHTAAEAKLRGCRDGRQPEMEEALLRVAGWSRVLRPCKPQRRTCLWGFQLQPESSALTCQASYRDIHVSYGGGKGWTAIPSPWGWRTDNDNRLVHSLGSVNS
jgi:hypothetical protein